MVCAIWDGIVGGGVDFGGGLEMRGEFCCGVIGAVSEDGGGVFGLLAGGTAWIAIVPPTPDFWPIKRAVRKTPAIRLAEACTPGGQNGASAVASAATSFGRPSRSFARHL